MGQGPQGFSFIDITQPPYSCDPTGVADCSAGLTQAIADCGGTLWVPMNGRSNGRYRISSQVDVNRSIALRGPSPSTGNVSNALVSFEADNGIAPFKISAGGVALGGFALKHRDYLGNLPALGYIFPQWRPSTSVALNRIWVPTFSPSGPGSSARHWGWALKCTTAGITGATEPSWSGLTVNPKDAAAPSTVSDNSVVWTPVMVNGLEVEGKCDVEGLLWVIGFPSNGVNHHCSQGYTPSVNANLAGFRRIIAEGCGGSGYLRFGSDVGACSTHGFDMRGNRYAGFNDIGSTNTVHTAHHAAVNETLDYLGENCTFDDPYCELGYGIALIRANAAWRDGTAPVSYGSTGVAGELGFSGIVGSGYAQIPYWQPDTAYSVNYVIKPPALAKSPQSIDATGYFYKIKEQRVTSRSQGVFTANSGTDFITFAGGHELENGDVVNVANSGGALPTGLSAATNYYIIGKSGNDMQLSLTRGGAAINFTTNGTGTQTATAVLWNPGNGTSVASVTYTASNSAGDLLLTTAGAHGRSVGDKLVVINSGGTFPGNVAANTTYYVQAVPLTTTMKLATASGGPAIAYSSAGTGTNKFALQPIWKTGMPIHGPGDNAALDKYGDCTDGTCRWECYQVSEVSLGKIDLPGRRFNGAFVSRYTGEVCWPGGKNPNEALALGRSNASLGVSWAFRFPTAGSDLMEIFKTGSAAIQFGDGTTSLGDGRVGFPAGYSVGGTGTYTRTVNGTSATITTGTWAAGDRVINVPPTVGQPKAWSCTVAGTPGTWVSEGNL